MDCARPHRQSLRTRVVLAFALSAALVALLLVVSVYTIGRDYLTDQRQSSAERLAHAHSELLFTHLGQPGTAEHRALLSVHSAPGTVLALRWKSRWVLTGPREVRAGIDLSELAGPSALAPAQVLVEGEPYLRVGVAVDGEGDVLYEFTPMAEFYAMLRVLRTLLISCAVAAAAIGALLGVWAGRRVLNPLRQVAGTAGRIASGELELRLPATRDRDLSMTVDAFNAMVDSLQERIERERRLVGDVSHELRTPLTTLTTGIDVMQRYRDDLPDRSRRALDLVDAEVDHLRRMLDDMLELARVEAGVRRGAAEPLALGELLAETLRHRRYPARLLTVAADATVVGHKFELERAVANLLGNATEHGGGAVAVTVDRAGEQALIVVDDAGPGVPPEERDRIFERFATARAGRRSAAGTGIGLALVAETIAAHGGGVECGDRPGGGARFSIRLPIAK
ncbi:HAMP domain-containing sensor histidine kinase [Nocardia terpenica]|uniref:HAMP domain-containing sensor histidine kinase n=1 Tax=Nocardia terpenica TaxID=455432 RepID=UPI002B4B62CE|nr:HAMP domain-containing sensor histidine kinase [Nocardia terpenica]